MKRHTSPVWALLRRNISAWQLGGFALANLVGMVIILAAVQFYFDALPATQPTDGQSDENLLTRDYMVISKQVHGLAAGDNGFSQQQIAELETQPWVRRVGSFSSSQFQVKASIEMGGRGMSTYLFFEAIPDEFIDVQPDGWHFNPDEPYASPIPIIISKDYLALYNFGFAPTQGLPRLSEKVISTVPITLKLAGPYGTATLDAYICGFSRRLNTIAVPQAFMDWANQNFAPGESSEPSRLIVETNAPGDPRINEYLAANELEAAGDRELTDRAGRYLAIMTTGISAVGTVISALALFILLLSLHLLLQKSRTKLRDLMLLGYSPQRVGSYYRRLIGTLNAGVAIAAIIATLCLRTLWVEGLAEIGIEAAFPWQFMPVVVGICLLITAVNFAAISRTLRATFRGDE